MDATTRAEKQQGGSRQAAPSFDAMHGELASEAHAVARELSVDVVTVAFCPDGVDVGAGVDDSPLAVSHEFLGIAPDERVRRLVAADVSAMGPAELARHAARLRAVRAAVVREMLGTGKGEKNQGVDGEVEAVGTGPGREGDAQHRHRRGQQDQEGVVG